MNAAEVCSERTTKTKSHLLKQVVVDITHKSLRRISEQKSKHFVIRTPKIQTKISKISHKNIIYLQFASIKERI